MRSYVEVNKETGFKCLTVFYDRNLDNFDQAIEKALSQHGLKPGDAAVIALPKTVRSGGKFYGKATAVCKVERN